MRKLVVFFLVLIALATVGCKSEEERQDQAYFHNVSASEKLAATYPAFKDYLTEGSKKATMLYDDADSLDEEARAAQLKAANEAFGPAFHALNQYTNLESDIRKGVERLDRKRARSYSTGADKRTIWEESDRILEEAHKTISQLQPENENQGAAEVLRQVTRLQTLDNRVSEVLRKAESEERRERERRRKKKKAKTQ